MKQIIVLLISAILALIATFYMYKDKEESPIGTKILLDKDTLTIVDYNRWEDTYTLSNGIRISPLLLVNNRLLYK